MKQSDTDQTSFKNIYNVSSNTTFIQNISKVFASLGINFDEGKHFYCFPHNVISFYGQDAVFEDRKDDYQFRFSRFAAYTGNVENNDAAFD